MRRLLLNFFILFLALLGGAVAQLGPRVQLSHTTEALRGASAVSQKVAWASGTRGTYLVTADGGRTWTPGQVPDAGTLDFRAVVAFSADEAFLMSAGPGEQSRIYFTSDGGKHWQLQFTNTNPKGFFDSMVFWDSKHGVVLGDPIPDESGKPKFELLMTEDGQNWRVIPPAQLPPAMEGEGAFAASNTCLAIVPGASGDSNLWFATGGKAARVFHSADRGQSWHVSDTPMMHGRDSAGIFSIAFRDPLHGVIAGGDYKVPNGDGPNLAFTEDGGKTWTLSPLHPLAYFSSVAYDRRVNEAALREGASLKQVRVKPISPERLFIVGQDFVFDFRPPSSPRRINGKKKLGILFNAASAYPEGGVFVVGPKGAIAYIP
jgi:photosystem II stability/assembly factor-like uncharacterized protein